MAPPGKMAVQAFLPVKMPPQTPSARETGEEFNFHSFFSLVCTRHDKAYLCANSMMP
jgi:hypothetical protein